MAPPPPPHPPTNPGKVCCKTDELAMRRRLTIKNPLKNKMSVFCLYVELLARNTAQNLCEGGGGGGSRPACTVCTTNSFIQEGICC